jgi:D-serine deaminase-like pyridoxal phosphate-dependent protein
MLDSSRLADLDTPALLLYDIAFRHNIRCAKEIIGDMSRLRPHIKTHKTREICEILMREGVTKFKCATISEAETLALAGAPDILMAYQPIGPKIERFLHLIMAYPDSRFSCLVDDATNAMVMDCAFEKSSYKLDLYIDVNIGMNRTGIPPASAGGLAMYIKKDCPNLRLVGVHGYDGHLCDEDLDVRTSGANFSYFCLSHAAKEAGIIMGYGMKKIIGGSPTFAIHAQRKDVECSPGTFVFWDYGYQTTYPDLPFRCAVYILCRVISVVNDTHVCIDLGYKSVASEMPLPRVCIMGDDTINPRKQYEEHLVIEVQNSDHYPVGTMLFAIPEHICPTIALHENLYVIRNEEISETWRIIARDRYINI